MSDASSYLTVLSVIKCTGSIMARLLDESIFAVNHEDMVAYTRNWGVNLLDVRSFARNRCI